MNYTFPTKTAAEVRDYGFDWTRDLEEANAAISTSAWASTPAGLTLTGPALTATTTATRIAGGVAGTTYVITNTVTLSTGETGVAIAELYVR